MPDTGAIAPLPRPPAPRVRLYRAPPPAPRQTQGVMQEILLGVVGCGMLLPYAAIFTLGGAATRTLYPLYCLIVGLAMIRHRRALYPSFVVIVFVMAPFLRRVIDEHAGFQQFNLVLLAPYVTLLPTLVPLLRQSLGFSRHGSWPFTLMLGCFVYGSFIALFEARLVPGLYEPLRWALPVALAAYIIESCEEVDEIRRRLIWSLCIIVPVMTLYGIYQYVSPPAWDRLWLVNANNPTFGSPVPFGVRVFSLMNSPGSTGMFTAFAIVLLVSEGGLFALIGLAGMPLLALTMLRVGWVACAAGLLVVLVQAPARRKAGFIAAVAVLAVVGSLFAGSLQLSPNVSHALQERLDSFTSLSKDTSASDRLHTYSTFLERFSDEVMGEGYGANASMATMTELHQEVPLDSGIMEALLIYGLIGGLIYFIALGGVTLEAYRASRQAAGMLAGSFAVIVGQIVTFPGGSNQIGESGLLAWIGVGLLLAHAARLQVLHRR
jgi:hypothetical protein